jgi:cytoskeletal protein CcmA (bactofilin family)
MAQESTKRGGAKAPPANGAPSIIAAGLKIIGNVVSGGVVHIEGEVDGDIQCTELTIGAGGTVNGHVTATSVHVLGRMAGTIRGRRVRISRGATVTGEVIHERLMVEAGARLDGYYRPVEKLDISAAVDVRRQIGRASRGESLLPRRILPPFRNRPRSTVSLRHPSDTTTKPLH